MPRKPRNPRRVSGIRKGFENRTVDCHWSFVISAIDYQPMTHNWLFIIRLLLTMFTVSFLPPPLQAPSKLCTEFPEVFHIYVDISVNVERFLNDSPGRTSKFRCRSLIHEDWVKENVHKSYPQVMWITLAKKFNEPSTYHPELCTCPSTFRSNKTKNNDWLSRAIKHTVMRVVPTMFPHEFSSFFITFPICFTLEKLTQTFPHIRLQNIGASTVAL